MDGTTLGLGVGSKDGVMVGPPVGIPLRETVGFTDGNLVGGMLGVDVGDCVG